MLKTRTFIALAVILLLGVLLVLVDRRLADSYARYRDSDFRAFEWDSATLWRLKRSYEGQAFDTTIRTNAQGFRAEVEYPLSSAHGVRILALGDSRTYGFLVGEQETFAAVLQQELRARGVDAEVINAGVHGFSAVQCLAYLRALQAYRPDVVVYAPGYNDRRYLLVRPPDTPSSLRNLARLRTVVDFVQRSNLMFALFYRIGREKMADLRYNPPPLNETPVRVEVAEFQDSLRQAALFCRQAGIRLVLFHIDQNPLVYGEVEQGIALYRQGNDQEAIAHLAGCLRELYPHAQPLCRYYLGLSHQALGETASAEGYFREHRPIPSIFGQFVLRSEQDYLEASSSLAARENLPWLRAKLLIQAQTPPDLDPEEFFTSTFVDECHYDARAHAAMGKGLAQLLAGLPDL